MIKLSSTCTSYITAQSSKDRKMYSYRLRSRDITAKVKFILVETKLIVKLSPTFIQISELLSSYIYITAVLLFTASDIINKENTTVVKLLKTSNLFKLVTQNIFWKKNCRVMNTKTDCRVRHWYNRICNKGLKR